MSPSRRVLCRVLSIVSLIAICGTPARAQFYDSALRAIELADPFAVRSPRLLGMGRLTLAVEDADQGLGMWDFARNPLGAFDDDTTSTLELRGGSSAANGVRDIVGTAQLREHLGARGNALPIEAFHRSADSKSAYGAVAAIRYLRTDQPLGLDLEQRSQLSVPSIEPILTGPFPWWGKGKLRYAMRFRFEGERIEHQFRQFLRNANGEFIDQNGTFAAVTNTFTPDEYRVISQGVGAGLSHPVFGRTTLALMADVLAQRIQGSNVGSRHASEQREKRPYGIGQATLHGRIGSGLEWAADGKAWTATSQQNWVFTTSAGIGAVPLTGRGKLLEREEEGTQMQARMRYAAGSWSLGARGWTEYGKVVITPPARDDLTSLNHFLNVVSGRANADTIVLPDSIVANESERRGFGFGGGASWSMPRGTLGAEFQWYRDRDQSLLSGFGPNRSGWDARVGAEYRCSSVVTGRAGYMYRSVDRDEVLAQNEFTGQTMTLGLGLRPPGTHWWFESGYAFEWLSADFGDPTSPREGRQSLLAKVHWAF